ncbi:MAG: efflux RND transporter periplasmic adaptor subunit [Woeseiaceae bacterium]
MQDRVSVPLRVMMIAAILAATVSCSGNDTEEVREPVVRPVKLFTLSAASDLEMARYPAVIDAGRYGELSFQISGRLEELAATEGQELTAGDLIARLDPRDFESQLTSARAQFQNAEEEYQRAVRLSKEDAIARSVLEQRLTQRDVSQAQLNAAEKALEDSVLLAPFSGVVADVPVRQGQTVSAGQLVTALIDLSTLEVTVNLPARVIAESQETEDRGTFVFLEAAPDVRIPAQYSEANLLADTATQTYGVTFTFEPPENLIILPGMNATVELSSARRSAGTGENRHSVPLSAVVGAGDDTYIWVVDPDSMTVEKRKVVVADGVGEYAIVTEGLVAGEMIASAGASFLSEGMQVQAWSE